MRRPAMVGMLLVPAGCGTAVGGYAGNQIGHDSGKPAATAAGVIGGELLGHALTGW